MSIPKYIILNPEVGLNQLVQELLDQINTKSQAELLIVSDLKPADADCLATLISAAVAASHTVRLIAVNLPTAPAMLNLLGCGTRGERLVLINGQHKDLATQTTCKKNSEQYIKNGLIDQVITTFPAPLSRACASD